MNRWGHKVTQSDSTTVGDVVALQRGTTYKSSLLGQPGPVLLGLATIERDGGFRDGNLVTYGGDSPDKLLLRPGDLYVSLKDVTQSGDLLGAVARLPKSVACGRLTQDTVKLILKGRSFSPSYLYWLLRTPTYRRYCRERGIGTTNLALSREDFLHYPVPPETPARAEIVALLDVIESKIDLNCKMNQTLEAMAQALFRSWFVDFDPVIAKREGRQPFGMDTDTAALFPAHFQESELGPIPEGWTVSTIGSEVKVVGGSTPRTGVSEYWADGQHCWVTPRDLSRLSNPVVRDSKRKITDAGLAQISSGLLPAGTVLLSSRAPIGYTAIAAVPVAVNQGFIAMRCAELLGPQFVLRWTQDSMDEVVARAGGTTFAEISKAAFRPIRLVVPSETIARRYEAQAGLWHDQIIANVRESEMLVSLRELLLRTLFSNEIQLKSAERAVADVG